MWTSYRGGDIRRHRQANAGALSSVGGVQRFGTDAGGRVVGFAAIGMACAWAGDRDEPAGRVFLHIAGERTVDLPWDEIDDAWLETLGIASAEDRLRARAASLADAEVGAVRRVRLLAAVVSLEVRPDGRLTEDDLLAWLGADAPPAPAPGWLVEP